jgi:CBS domain-containing protein
MTLAEIMTQPPITVRDDATVDEVAARMIEQKIGCLPVVSSAGQLVGIVTACDFGAKQGSCPFPLFCASGFPDGPAGEPGHHGVAAGLLPSVRTVREIMTPQPIVLPEDASVVEAVAKMLHLGFDHIPVVRDGVPVGIVAREDLLRLTLKLLSGGPPDAQRALGAAAATTRAAVPPQAG